MKSGRRNRPIDVIESGYEWFMCNSRNYLRPEKRKRVPRAEEIQKKARKEKVFRFATSLRTNKDQSFKIIEKIASVYGYTVPNVMKK